MQLKTIGFGGGCHWCTEAYFQSLKGVAKVEQGWISADAPNEDFSEAVLVHYDSEKIPLEVLVAVHLHTHAATSNHSFREKYRSAIYILDGRVEEVQKIIKNLQPDFSEVIITEVLNFKTFKLNEPNQLDYFKKNRDGVFCERYIHPKLALLENMYRNYFIKI